MSIDRKLKMVLTRNDFEDVLEKHMRRAKSQKERVDVAASALMVSAASMAVVMAGKVISEDDAIDTAIKFLREMRRR